MSGVHFSSHTNSTHFTNCCNTAICEYETHCPNCNEEVPYSQRERHEMAMLRLYGADKLQQMRSKYEKDNG